jgi:hypothetical protein
MQRTCRSDADGVNGFVTSMAYFSSFCVLRWGDKGLASLASGGGYRAGTSLMHRQDCAFIFAGSQPSVILQICTLLEGRNGRQNAEQ